MWREEKMKCHSQAPCFRVSRCCLHLIPLRNSGRFLFVRSLTSHPLSAFTRRPFPSRPDAVSSQEQNRLSPRHCSAKYSFLANGVFCQCGLLCGGAACPRSVTNHPFGPLPGARRDVCTYTPCVPRRSFARRWRQSSKRSSMKLIDHVHVYKVLMLERFKHGGNFF